MNTSKGLIPGLALLFGLYGMGQAAAPFVPDLQPVGYVGQTAATSTQVTSGNEVLYSIDYNALNWSGNLHAYSISAIGLVNTGADLWGYGAAHQIDLQDWDTGRLIATVSGGEKVPFRWTSLSSADQGELGGEAVLNFIRGDRSNEKPNGDNYRARASVLGDIIHSTPVYCPAYVCSAATVFVGANDGMLHAIDAADGDERFAYVPSMLIPKLKFLKADPYSHKYFVDGRLALGTFGTQTILAGALGSGGKGLFALDVSNAAASTEADAASKILWEISNASSGFANLGDTYGKPVLARLTDNTPVLIVGNGYNNTGNGHAVLYIIKAVDGSKLAEIDTGSGSTASPNGLSSPAVVYDNNGRASIAYAGDIDGNLWKFDLSANTATKLFTTDPAQAITMAPGFTAHPNGGYMVTFVTGRMFTSADESDTAAHYAYGIWDRPADYAANNSLLTQTLVESTWTDPADAGSTVRVRTATANPPNWTAGTEGHMGWRTTLPIGGERVVGDGAYVSSAGQFVFLSTNPTISPDATPPGENWWMQLNALTGGDSGVVIFDLNGDMKFDSDDLVTAGKPVGRYFGGGVRSQLIPLTATSVQVAIATYDMNGEPPAEPEVGDGSGVSGGHFDYDIYYGVQTTIYTPTSSAQTKSVCAKTKDVSGQINTLATSFCNTSNGFSSGYGYMTAFTTGAQCTDSKGELIKDVYNQSITCNTYTTSTGVGSYGNKKHYHEYDDVFDVTGVNMLNASEPLFNLSPNVISSATATTPEFKILVMNQFLNPAAKLSVGGAAEVNVKTYGNLASQTDAAALLTGLPTYSRATVNSLVFNLPLHAFKSIDWWGTGGDGVPRAGLIPTQTGCVNKVNADGSMLNSSGKGLPGPNGERFNGALTIQIIKANTPASALELNHNGGDVRYGWRVKQAEFKNYVIAEYTAFWHHPNGKCYGQSGWVPNPPEDFVSDATPKTPAPGSADPKDGVFGVVGGTDGTDTPPPPGDGDTDGSGTSTGVTTGGQVLTGGGIGGVIVNGENVTGGNTFFLGTTGRVNWRELRQ